jgi:hypothetical protein
MTNHIKNKPKPKVHGNMEKKTYHKKFVHNMEKLEMLGCS